MATLATEFILEETASKATGVSIIKPRPRIKVSIFSLLIKEEDISILEDGLVSLEMIGKGRRGEVYKAVLPATGKEIVIKKINQTLKEGEELSSRIIVKEIMTIGLVRHRNLVPLLAHLSEPDCHYLIYEYIRNGSLHDYLQLVANGRAELNWWERYQIALGVAHGLEHLHMNHNPCIFHRDLTPANILLDDEMEARISDFGLARVVPDDITHVSTSCIAGTVGYIAPEYYKTYKFNDKCDVYSFGVVLGVLVTGKLPSHEFFQCSEELSMVKWMRNVMCSEDPKRAIDGKMLGNGYEEQMMLVLELSCLCTLEDPKERPNSKEARLKLERLNPF